MQALLKEVEDFSEQQLEKISAFVELLLKWNKKINLIGKTTEKQVWERHILDSSQLLNYIPKGTKEIVDFGSGAGFPGIVLAILGDYEVTLVEGNNKKCSFLKEAVRVSRTNVRIITGRIEDLEAWKPDVITARALAPLDKLLQMCSPFLSRKTCCLFLKGKEIKKELEATKPLWEFDEKLYKSMVVPDIKSNQGWVLELKNIRPK